MASVAKTPKQELQQIVEASHCYKDVLRKLGYKTFNGRNIDTLKKYINKYNISIEHFSRGQQIKRTKENVFCKDSTATQRVLRYWYIKEEYSEYKCQICGNDGIWNGKKLVLQLDHIDGDNKNNVLSNLRWLCPNCHSQTDTFGSKNGINIEENKPKKQNFCPICGKPISKQSKHCRSCDSFLKRSVERPEPEQLKQELIESNFTAVGRKYGVTGGAIKKWCQDYGLPTKSKDYKE